MDIMKEFTLSSTANEIIALFCEDLPDTKKSQMEVFSLRCSTGIA